MRFAEFERRAWADWARIPEEYKAGVDGLIIDRSARPHPELPDVYTLGECLTEDYPSDFHGPETSRSVVVLYYGSFHRLAALDPDFDWAGELWETLTHELQHHLESLAREDALDDMDYAVDQDFKRREGQPFDAFYYRAGERLTEGAYRVAGTVFLERPVERRTARVSFAWQGRDFMVQPPMLSSPVVFLQVVEGVPLTDDEELYLVLVQHSGLAAIFRALWRRRPAEIAQGEVRAELVTEQSAVEGEH